MDTTAERGLHPADLDDAYGITPYGGPFFVTIQVWTDDTKAHPITSAPITTFASIGTHLLLNQAYEYTVNLYLEDPATQGIAAGHYIEVMWGIKNPDLLLAGYILDMVATEDDAGTISLTVHSASIALTHYNNLDRFVAGPPAYGNIDDVINGLVPLADRPAPPGKKGFLDPTGWWADWVTAAGDTTRPPGAGDTGRADWGNPYQNVTTIADVYSLFWREERGSTGSKGRIAYGPLGDDSGLWAFGGDVLTTPSSTVALTPLPTPSSAAVQSGFGQVFRVGEPVTVGSQTGKITSIDGDVLRISGLGYTPNPGDPISQGYKAVSAFDAQRRNLIVISAATVDQSTTNLKNIIFPMGRGTGDHMITLRSIFGDVFLPNGSLAPGVSRMQLNAANHGQVLYIQSGNKQSWRGNQYVLCAVQGNDAQWNYGLMDLTSVNTYGAIFLEHRFPRAGNADILLSLAAGFLDSAARPVPSWTFGLRYPLLHRDTPARIWPGKLVHIVYSGRVHNAIERDSTGQWVGSGAYQYLSFPGTSDPYSLFYLNRTTDVTEQFDDSGYTATITMGKGRKKAKTDRMVEQLATDFEQHRKTPPHQAFSEVPFGHVEWVTSKEPHRAYVDEAQRAIVLTPGSWMFTDIADAIWFHDHRKFEFDVTVSDETSVFEFCFAKALGGTLTGIASSNVYGVYRMAFAKSGQHSGFYTTQDGVAYTHHGMEPKVLPHGRYSAGRYRVSVWMSGAKYEVNVTTQDRDSGDGVPGHDTVAVWTDKLGTGGRVIDLDKGWGAVGFRLTAGSSFCTITNVSARYEKKQHRATQGGHGKHHVVIHEGSTAGGVSGTRTIKADEDRNVAITAHLTTAEGTHHTLAHKAHGPFGNTSAIVGSLAYSGATTTVLFNQTVLNGDPQDPIMPHAFMSGWLIQLADGSGETIQVGSVLRGYDVANPQIQRTDGPYVVGFTTTDPNAAALQVGSALVWDALDLAHGAVGHLALGTLFHYKGKDGRWHRDWCHALMAAGVPVSPGSKPEQRRALIIAPDGTIHHADVGQITQANGQVISIADLAVSAKHFATKTEHEGAALFDAGEFDSATQRARLYPPTYPTAGSTVLTPDSAGFYGGDPSLYQASWVAASTDGQTGEADAILQLTATAAEPTILWQDTIIQLDSGDHRAYKVTKDASFRFPILIGIGQASNTLRIGGMGTLRDPVSPGANVKLFTDTDPHMYGTQTNDTWVINPGGTTQETITVVGLSGMDFSITAASVAHAHDPGETLAMATADGGTTVVQSGGLLDGTTTLGDVTPAINAIAVGFYDGTSWYRGWWGDPTWKAPYLQDATLPGYAAGQGMGWLGKLNLAPGKWADLSCKASQLGLFAPHLPQVTIVGVEIAIYGANAGTGQTVYFDGHEHGFVANKGKGKAGSTGSDQLGAGAVKTKNKDPQHHADSHTHSDVVFWMDSGDQLHWESGWLVNHDGSNQWVINGGTEASPNTGISAILFGQPNGAGNYILFNTTNAAISIKDPTYGTVTIPAYSAAGGAGGQTVGFGVVSEAYKFHARTSGAAVKGGLPKGLYKIGKVSKNRDGYSGELGVQTHHGSGKKQNRHLRDNSADGAKVRPKTLHGGETAGGSTQKDHHADASHSRRHDQHHKPTRGHHINGMRYEMVTSGGIDSLQLTGGNVEIDDGLTTYTVQSRTWQVNAGDWIYINRTEASPYFPHSVSSATWAASATDDWIQLLRISKTRDGDGLLATVGHHHGPHKVHGDRHVKAKTLHGGESGHVDHHADKSHSRRHLMHHHPSHHIHRNGLTFEMSKSGSFDMLTVNAGYVEINDAQTSYQVAARTWAVNTGDWIYIDTTAASPFTPQSTNGAGWAGRPDSWIQLLRISADRDSDGLLSTEGHHHGPHKVHGKHLKPKTLHGGEPNTAGGNHPDHHADKSHSRRHLMHHHPSHHIPRNGASFEMGTSDVLTVTHGWLDINDGATSYEISARSFGVAAGDFIYIDISGFAPYTPLNAANAVWSSSKTDTWVQLTRISADRDADGLLSTEGHHHGPHKAHGKHIKAKTLHGGEPISGGGTYPDHHATKSHTRRHLHDHNPSRHHHHDTSFEMGGSAPGTLYINYTSGPSGPAAPTFVSYVQSSDGLNAYQVNHTFITGVQPGDWIYIDTTNYSGGALTPQRSPAGVWTDSNDNYIVLCRISSRTDGNGYYTTAGHHFGPHKVHDIHVKPGAIFNRHLDSIAVTGGKMNWDYRIPNVLMNTTLAIQEPTLGGQYAVTAPVGITLALTADQYNEIHTNGWFLGYGYVSAGGTMTYQSMPIFAHSFAHPYNSPVPASSLPFDVGNITWAGPFADRGFIVNQLQLNPTQVNLIVQGVSVGGGGWVNDTIKFWIQYNGILH